MSARGLMRAEVPSATLAIVTDDDLPLLTRSLSGRQLLALDILLAAGYTLVLATMAAAAPPAAAGPGQLPAWLRPAIILAMGFPLALGGCGRCRVRHQLAASLWRSARASSATGRRVGFALYTVAVTEGRSAREPPVVALASVLASWCSSSLAAGATCGRGGTGAHRRGGLGGSWTIGRAVRERRRFAHRSRERAVERAVRGREASVAGPA